MINRSRAKGRRGGEQELFAYLPKSVMEHPSLATSSHAAFRVLAILLVGNPRERNGTLACSDKYAARFDVPKDTNARAKAILTERGLIVVTRRVEKFSKWPTLYGVTWWPIYNREGQPLALPEPASHAYRNWKPTEISSPRSSDPLTPMVRVETPLHHPDLTPKTPIHHPDGRGNSRFSVGGQSFAKFLPRVLVRKVRDLAARQPHMSDNDIALAFRRDGVDPHDVRLIRQEMDL